MDSPRMMPLLVRRCVLCVTILISLVGVPSPPALAHQPVDLASFVPSHFNGQDRCHGPDTNCGGDAGDNNEGQMATDRFDGIDSIYRFRAVSTPEARYYEWYHCRDLTSPYTGGPCTFIGRDDTPVLSTPPPGVSPVAIFEFDWDIPDPSVAPPLGQDVYTVACIDGPPSTPNHCKSDPINLHVDDFATPDHAPTTSGQFVNLSHGGVVANAGFTAIAYSSADDIGRILFCLDPGTNAITGDNLSPAGGCNGSPRDAEPNDSPGCQSVPPEILCWEADVDPPDNSEFSFKIVEQDDPRSPVESGSGDCEGDTDVGGDGGNTGDDCQLDKIYLTSLASPPGAPGPPGPPGPPGAPGPPGGQPECPGFDDDPRTQIVGSAEDDVLQGTAEADVMCGLGGDDVLSAFGGADLLLGGGGRDRLRGQQGSDQLRGEQGRDALGGGAGPDRLDGGPARDLCRGGRGKDVETRCEGG